MTTPEWLKGRGYLHITPKINVFERAGELISKIQNPSFVNKHAFFPLIHSIIKERKYKKHPENPKVRAHTHFHNGRHKSAAKSRPLHYATHIDSLIFGYYSHLLSELYEKKIERYSDLHECIIAYRKIAMSEGDEDAGKSTINFAYEVFNSIKQRAESECIVLMFDIKSFFSEIDHKLLKLAWCELLNVNILPKDHYNVFNAATNFRYILRDELRLNGKNGRRRSGFDERKLAEIRKIHGKECFFESLKDFRNAIKGKQITVYKKPFVKAGIAVGIPQGLPISATLANLYLYQFDLAVLQKVVRNLNGFYRRYSDDILIICDKGQETNIKEFVRAEIEKSKVSISNEKTETYLFKPVSTKKGSKLQSFIVNEDGRIEKKPLTYLGFEFSGEKILIKSANLAKFYRRMIYAVKRKAARAVKISKETDTPPVIYKGRLKRLYSRFRLNSAKQFRKNKKLTLRPDGYYEYKFKKVEREHTSNYFSYVRRSSRLMREPGIVKQLKKHKAIFNDAMSRQIMKAQKRMD